MNFKRRKGGNFCLPPTRLCGEKLRAMRYIIDACFARERIGVCAC